MSNVVNDISFRFYHSDDTTFYNKKIIILNPYYTNSVNQIIDGVTRLKTFTSQRQDYQIIIVNEGKFSFNEPLFNEFDRITVDSGI